MDKQLAKKKAVAALDDIAKATASLIVTGIVTSIVDNAYDKYIINRRNPSPLEEQHDAQEGN